MVSSAKIEMTASVFMPRRSWLIVAKSVYLWRILRTIKRNFMTVPDRPMLV
jgi:hypothetical protein